MKTTTIGAYPRPSYLKIPDWFQNIDNTPMDWDRAWKLLGNQKDKLIKKLVKKTLSSKIKDYNKGS